LAVILIPGQAGDNPQLLPLLDEIRDLEVDGQWVRVGRVLADKAYTHPGTRQALRSRRIKATIPERIDQIARRKAKGSAGGWPPVFILADHVHPELTEVFWDRSTWTSPART
jgi:hypothetical protein